MKIGDASQSGDILATNVRYTNFNGMQALMVKQAAFNRQNTDRYRGVLPILIPYQW